MNTFRAVIAAALLVATAGAAAGDARSGAAVYRLKCQVCHGEEGDAGHRGGLQSAANFARLEANSPRVRALLQRLSVEDHARVVRLGGAASGVAGAGALMPRLGLSETEISDVVAYERTLGAFTSHPKNSPR